MATKPVDRDGVVEVALPTRGRRPFLFAIAGLVALSAVAALSMVYATRPTVHRTSLPETTAAVVETPTARAYELRARAREESKEEMSPAERPKDGIYAFPPPGTKKIKQGIVVPEDFLLPSGYMRHYQTTDQGEMLRAILVFHPDHKPTDSAGNPYPIPDDRVVPPELVPPGMPVERLEVPADAYADPEAERAAAGR